MGERRRRDAGAPPTPGRARRQRSFPADTWKRRRRRLDGWIRSRTSTLLSRILRHAPAAVGISLDPAGWVPVETLLIALREHGHRLSREEFGRLVAGSDKQRFAIDPVTDRIHRVGGRRGRHAVLVVRAGAMHADGHLFSVSGNGVWLTRQVSARYLSRLAAARPGSD